MRLGLSAGYDGSLHAAAVLQLLVREGHTVEEVFVVRAYSAKRLRQFAKQLDAKELRKKVVDRLLPRGLRTITGGASPEIEYVEDYFEERGLRHRTVSAAAQALGISVVHVDSLNSAEVVRRCERLDLLVYCGGGIVGKQLLGAPSIGTLNCHAAKLPAVRGMNTLEWSILLDEELGNTLHFMVEKVDRGGILKFVPRDYSSCRTISEARGLGIVYTIEDLLEGVRLLQSGNYETTPQAAADGTTYYTMHPTLRAYTEARLQNR